MLHRRRLRPFSYRMGTDVHTFYTLDRDTADKYAAQWARDHGHKSVVRLKKREPTR